ncbi:histone deacetylase complex subunit SAP130 isoform X2 [Venturia canescens]|nr:histone deacetylase complex subunit SAP130 isoform X2 [Venturia canescens]
MNTNVNSMDGDGEKRMPETSISMPAHSLTTIQNLQNVQNVQNIVQTNIQTIQPVQSVIGSVSTTNPLVGKSVSVDLNPKLSLMKPIVQSGITSSTEANKITTTLCSVGPTVRIIPPGMLSTVDRQTQPQVQQQTQQTQQIVTSIPATYHVPRGPAAVANISAPRSTVATPIVRACTGQVVPISRPGLNTSSANPQWQSKTTSVVYAQPQRHSVPPVNRITTRPPTAVYSGQQQPRLVTPVQGRPVQATMVTGVQGQPSRLIAPVLQTNNNIARIPVAARPTTPQVSNITTTIQPGRPLTQPLQANQISRPLTATGTVNRIAVSAPVMGPMNRITNATSVTVQPTVGRQLTINPTTGVSTATVSRIVLPQQAPIQVQQQLQSQGGPRVVQTVTSLANIGTVSRVIATTSSAPAQVTRVTPAAPTSVARITGMALHSLPLPPTRTAPTPVKTISAQSIAQAVQLAKQQQQQQQQQPVQQQQQQPQGIRITSGNSNPSAVSNINSNNNITPTNNSNSNNNLNTGNPQPVQGLYLNSPQTTTYYSVEPSGAYSQYRPTTVQPVRLLVEPTNYEETHAKPNASPRPSILRKRDHDNSPAKGVAKNLVPVLAALPSIASTSSPPGSPRGDRDGGGCQSSGSTTVSATSSPGLDEEPEQSRIPINQTVEMSPRKKPRKQQLTGVELTESRCHDEEMQFITEEKMKIKEETREKFGVERKQIPNLQQHDGRIVPHTPPVVMRTRPTPSLLGSSWKNRWGGSRLHHYRRPSDVRPREERRPTVAELAQQKHVLQKINGWKVYHLTAQMEDLAELEKQVHEKLKTTLMMLESQQIGKSRQDDGLERANELIKGNMQRSSLISEGMNEARSQLVTIFQHKGHVTDILQRCGNKRAQKKRDK